MDGKSYLLVVQTCWLLLQEKIWGNRLKCSQVWGNYVDCLSPLSI
jgi:hypothetical protein